MNPRGASGFTLIEMVIAFAILGLTLSVLYGTFDGALLRSHHDKHLSEGTLLAQSLLARAGTEWPLIEGTQDGDWNGYTYRLDEKALIAPADQPPFTLPMFEVSASVSWGEFAGRRTIRISTLKLASQVTP